MSDIAVVYTLTTSGGTVLFNDGDIPSFDDMLFITGLRGFDQAPLRTPQDDKPQADGGIVHKFFRGARHLTVEGEFLVQSTRIDSGIQVIRNAMIAALLAALQSIEAADGTLQWTPAGGSSRTLTVRSEIPLETDGVEQKTFTFGLVAANPNPV